MSTFDRHWYSAVSGVAAGVLFSFSFLFSSCATTSRGTMSEFEDQLEGIASYYAEDFHGRKTSNGEVYDMHALTAAHRTLPFNTKLRIVNLDNKRSVEVRINDRGPFIDNRIIDLSLKAALEIGMISSGTCPVRIEILELGQPSAH
jgi:rare lipoprotein A